MTFYQSYGIFRWIYLMEVKGQTPLPLMNPKLNLADGEFFVWP